jgi:lipid II:glycine glycyltransferase (peptidoglycan interpeptide bridge formation enzyme)
MACETKIDAYSVEEWAKFAEEFYDNNVYQSWAYQKIRAEYDGQSLKQIIIQDNNDVVLMFYMRIQKIPIIGIKIGYVQSGPLMHRNDGRMDKLPEALVMVRDLCFSKKMADVLRINPNIVDDENGKKIADIFMQNNILRANHIQPYHSMRTFLFETEDKIRAKLNKESRRLIRKAEERNFETREGTGSELFQVLTDLYAQAKIRKGFKGLDEEIFIKMQDVLHEHEKAKVRIIYNDGQPVTAMATTFYGNYAVPILYANNEVGLKLGTSYLVFWKVYIEAKAMGFEYYDLGGIDKDKNPQGYLFKRHLGSEEFFHIGAFEICKNFVVQILWHGIERIYNQIKILKS